MSDLTEKDLILNQFFKNVVFEGWNEETLRKASQDAGFDPVLGSHYFPNGVRDLMDTLAQSKDEALAKSVSPKKLEKMRVHEKITYLTRKRLELYTPYRAAIEAYGVHLVFPKNAVTSLKSIARTVDLIWFMAGDQSTDHNYYTKRGLLGVVYISTALYWMQDKSEGFKDSWVFLDRRIENVLSFGKTLSQFNLKDTVSKPADLFKDITKMPKRFLDRLNSRDI